MSEHETHEQEVSMKNVIFDQTPVTPDRTKVFPDMTYFTIGKTSRRWETHVVMRQNSFSGHQNLKVIK